jgi:phosphoribosylanthranilate isomerase
VGVEAKICGLTRPGDAALAAELGAAWLGVVFAGGPRQVTVALAREIVRAAGRVPVLGVFGDGPADAILQVVDEAGLAGVQAPYDSPVAAGRAPDTLIHWHVHRLASLGDVDALDGTPPAGAVLVEPRVPGKLGGAGVALDPALARAARDRLAGRTMALAGGLRPRTVRVAIDLVGPDIVDVSSGVERPGVPGVKDADLLRGFLEAVRG